ncbi:MAG: histidine phosphatase family protein [Roseiflexaceae bacterium]|nr:histidine phosphatase family protein [Roseiflexaceae bacterium]
MPTNLYIIRHGEAFSNVDGTLGGERGDKGLTERGFAQAHALAAHLEHKPIGAEVLYASTLLRARQTAEAIAPALGLPIIFDDEIQELRPGPEVDGLHFAAVRERYPQIDHFLRDVFTPLGPDGESWAMFQARVSAALDRIITAHQGKKIALVAHGGVVEVSFLSLLGLGPQARSRVAFHCRNTAITHWHYSEAHGGRPEWHLVRHNDDRHLDGQEL